MQTYTFICDGRTHTVKADSALEAMATANRQFLDKLPENPYPGAWNGNVVSGTRFVWASGNFFD